jgi:Mn2+/Fe2+ NRAMP family transporter
LKMGEFVNGTVIRITAWFVVILIASLNAWLLLQTFRNWFLG